MSVSISAIFARVFLFLLLTTEFIYLDFAGGIVRPYHFLVPAALFLMAPGVLRLWASPTFRALLLFLFFAVVSAVLSPFPSSALKSLILLVLNASIAAAMAAFLNSSRMMPLQFASALQRITFLSLAVAVVQFTAYRITGLAIGYSTEQVDQIRSGFAPSFYNEANGYAKFLITPFFLFLPVIVRGRIGRRYLLLYVLMTLAFFINFMRSALMGAFVATVVAALWYVWTRSFPAFFKRLAALAAVSTVALAWVLTSGIALSEYNSYKVANLFNLEAVSEDESWQFRSEAMMLAVRQTLTDPFRIFFGNGWGQVYAVLRGEVRQVGGADLVNIFAYNGLIGVAAYVLLLITALRAAVRRARRAVASNDRLLAEGLLFALVANVALGLVSGVMLWASFWLLIALSVVCDCESKRTAMPDLREIALA